MFISRHICIAPHTHTHTSFHHSNIVPIPSGYEPSKRVDHHTRLAAATGARFFTRPTSAPPLINILSTCSVFQVLVVYCRTRIDVCALRIPGNHKTPSRSLFLSRTKHHTIKSRYSPSGSPDNPVLGALHKQCTRGRDTNCSHVSCRLNYEVNRNRNASSSVPSVCSATVTVTEDRLWVGSGSKMMVKGHAAQKNPSRSKGH